MWQEVYPIWPHGGFLLMGVGWQSTPVAINWSLVGWKRRSFSNVFLPMSLFCSPPAHSVFPACGRSSLLSMGSFQSCTRCVHEVGWTSTPFVLAWVRAATWGCRAQDQLVVLTVAVGTGKYAQLPGRRPFQLDHTASLLFPAWTHTLV